ncbi:MAG: hypothetical protein WAK55_25985 [Xanthobacteraceae bacterium]
MIADHESIAVILDHVAAIVSIVEFRRAKLLQDARLSGITIEDIARALATMAGVNALSDFDAGLTRGVYLRKVETLLELTTEFAQERRRNDW